MPTEQLQSKIEQQNRLIAQLSEENETLYHQFNHLMIRNNKLLTRIDDQQRIIDDLHLRMEELQLISNNQLRLNDRLRKSPVAEEQSSADAGGIQKINLEALYLKWKGFPGQTAQNTPNLKKQSLILAALYHQGAMNANALFTFCNIGGVTGARYMARLKESGLVTYVGARKKGRYELTAEGIRFVAPAETMTETGKAVVPHAQQGIPVSVGSVVVGGL
jgi:predicted transcriptional regulator